MNKEELKEILAKKEANSRNVISDYYEGKNAAYEHALDLIDQLDELDEPETLSLEWIDKMTSPLDDEGRLYVWKSDLQNLLVPKQGEKKESPDALMARAFQNLGTAIKNSTGKRQAELELNSLGYVVIEKPVISQVWFEIIKKYKENETDLWDVIYEQAIFNDECDDFARAWLAYPNIEVEKPKHPILQAFDEKVKEYESYGSTSMRMAEVRKVLVETLEEEEE